MIRLALYIIGSLLVAALAAWLIALPGTVTIEVAGYRLQPGLGLAAFALILLLVLTIAVWAVIRRLLNAPRYLARRNRERRRNEGIAALTEAVVALQAGDAPRARQYAVEARMRLPDNRAAQLLQARAALAMGDMSSARDEYRALIENRSTAVAALSGLYDQARVQGRPKAALTFARRAISLTPNAAWAATAVFEDLAVRGEWLDALATAESRPAETREHKAMKRRQLAVLHTAQAAASEASDPLGALDHALAALKLVPDFVPAALVSARIHAHRGEARKAMSTLRRVWRLTGHPELATLFANAVPGASAVDRLKRVRELIDTPPQNRDAAIVLARAAVDAYEWAVARNALAPHSGASPTRAVCLLMAEIEEGQSADQGKAREWLARAAHAPADPAWTADGLVSPEWQPVSPVTGKLDAFVWKVPVSAASPPASPPAGSSDVALPAPVTSPPPPEPNPLAPGEPRQ